MLFKELLHSEMSKEFSGCFYTIPASPEDKCCLDVYSISAGISSSFVELENKLKCFFIHY